MALLPSFIGPTYQSQSPIADAELCINFYVEQMESEGAKSRAALYPTPGLSLFSSSTLSPNRGSFSQNGRAFVVIGFGFFEVNADGTKTQLGVVQADSNPATICSSGDLGNQLFITSGGVCYVLDLLTNTFHTDVVSGFNVVMGAYLDGFFLALTADSLLKISDYADGLTWDLTQFRARAASADRWVSMTVVHREIWLFGSQTYEVWQNTGASPYPFALIQGQVYNQGIVAPFSMAQLGESIGWLSQNQQGNGMFMVATQYAPERASNHAVEFAIQSYARQGFDISQVISMVYQEDGHTFFCLRFGGDIQKTWVYDQTTKMWHERGHWVTTGFQAAHFNAWQPAFHMMAFGKHLVGDAETGNIYRMGIDLFSDDGAVIRRIRRSPHVFNEKKRVRYNSFELDMQVGNGIVLGQGSDPKVMLRLSNNGGQTYGNEFQMASGKIGKYGTRVRRKRLGAPRDRVFEVSVSDPVPWRIVNAYLEYLPGAY